MTIVDIDRMFKGFSNQQLSNMVAEYIAYEDRREMRPGQFWELINDPSLKIDDDMYTVIKTCLSHEVCMRFREWVERVKE